MLLLAVVVGGFAADTEAQSVGVGLIGGWGHGPVTSRALGIDVGVALPLSFEAVGEATTWATAPGGDCPQSIPGSYACGVDGWSFTAGARWAPARIGRAFFPYVQALGGRFARSPVPPREDRPTALALQVGFDLTTGGTFSFGVGLRRMWVDDDGYARAFGEAMTYTMLMAHIGVEP